jgi:chromosome segregation protein
VNGREARARDVQTLLADLASGARSSAMVSQGRVGALVGARPEERRAILEEAAGITGLHARRHEAELKLRAAEANLDRSEDLRRQLDSQLDALRRQARQAARYRTISAVIRGAEAELLSLQHARAEAMRQAAEAAKIAAGRAVADATGAATRAATLSAETAAALPALREAEAVARTALERHRLAGEQMAAEIDRAQTALAQCKQMASQLDTDLAHARRQHSEADAALARLDEEAARLTAEESRHPPLLAEAEAATLAASDATQALDSECNRATELAADLAARSRAAQEALATADQRMRQLRDQQTRLSADHAQLQTGAVPPARLQAAEAEAAAAATLTEATRHDLAIAEAARTAAFTHAAAMREQATAEQARLRAHSRVTAEAMRREAASGLAQARAGATAAQTDRARLAAERQALAEILGVSDTERWPRMVDQLTVPAGLETALGAALGEELDSAADLDAARHWRILPPLDPVPALPPGVTPLDQLVAAPPALARAFSQIGLAGDNPDPSGLAPGQMLVSRDGAVWRWDGYTVRAGTQTQAAVRLQQGRRLAALTADLAAATTAAEAARIAMASADQDDRAARLAAEELEHSHRAQADAAEQRARLAARSAEEQATAAERAARAARDQADQRLTQARTQAAQLTTQAAAFTARVEALAGQEARLTVELAEASAQLEAIRMQSAGLADPKAARDDVERLRAALGLSRAQETAATKARDALIRAAEARTARKLRIAPERTDWTGRQRDAAGRATDLAARAEAAAGQLIHLAAAPQMLAERARAATEALDAAEATHRRHATTLADAETASQAADRAARAADQAASAAREALVRAEGEATQADHAWGSVAERVLDRIGATASLPPPPQDFSLDAEDRLRRRHDKLLREREEMGPVNLRAEIEAQEIETRIGAITREREELATAIAKLRGSIGHLNREGRERLAAVFTEVDGHFQALFARMFGGGKAHLALVGSDDPLTAGLEIFAQPPGKKLAALSLLSGGEQALCALSLIFAVFRCNPAPICVLDEVDAPLDDANVDRFCTLLEDMVRDTNTRFLVVTHHALTMARMDRLYGVTMQERGVSRLLSVDLQRAAAMVTETVARSAAA